MSNSLSLPLGTQSNSQDHLPADANPSLDVPSPHYNAEGHQTLGTESSASVKDEDNGQKQGLELDLSLHANSRVSTPSDLPSSALYGQLETFPENLIDGVFDFEETQWYMPSDRDDTGSRSQKAEGPQNILERDIREDKIICSNQDRERLQPPGNSNPELLMKPGEACKRL